MNTQEELRRTLRLIDHKGYKAYKDLEGSYRFPEYVLCIDHVQGDPFASPSRVRILYNNKGNIPEEFYCSKVRKTAAEDHLLRRLHRSLRHAADGGRRGSGKSGLITTCKVGQEILERTAVLLPSGPDCAAGGSTRATASPENRIEVRLEIGFPAYGRTIAAGELETILFDLLPAVLKQTFPFTPQLKKELTDAVFLADDQEQIRRELAARGLCAFVADGSILPRESGVSQKPMRDAVPFESPEQMAVTLELPHAGRIRGMGIPRGVTVIVGGGYHGKSTLLKALERGVYNHIRGDGREYVITDASACKLRAEEGRCIHREDISLFINHLPSKTDTTQFSSENASGSTSQAANTVEAVCGGSRLLLIDEDTSATNFMVRDAQMAQLVSDAKEPITPFLCKVRPLWEENGISTILVIGSSGAYLSAADHVIQMDCYEAKDVTQRAKELVQEWKDEHGHLIFKDTAFGNPSERMPDGRREAETGFPDCLPYKVRRRSIEKVRVHGWDTISLDRTELDLRYLEQITDETQTTALAYILQYTLEKFADGKKNAADLAREVWEKIGRDGLLSVVPRNYGAGAPAMVRRQEIQAALLRYREL